MTFDLLTHQQLLATVFGGLLIVCGLLIYLGVSRIDFRKEKKLIVNGKKQKDVFKGLL